MIYAAASFLGGITLPRLEQAYFPYDSGISVASAQAFFTAVASGMIARMVLRFGRVAAPAQSPACAAAN